MFLQSSTPIFRTARVPGVLAAVLFLLIAAPARSADEATIRLQGMIPVKCEIGIGADARDSAAMQFEVYKNQTLEEALRLDCNLPVAVSVRATEGALVRQTEDNDGNVTRSEIGYALSVDFPSIGRAGPYNGADLVSGVSFDSGDVVLFDEMGKLEMSFTAAEGLPAGAYTERLSFTVRPIE